MAYLTEGQVRESEGVDCNEVSSCCAVFQVGGTEGGYLGCSSVFVVL